MNGARAGVVVVVVVGRRRRRRRRPSVGVVVLVVGRRCRRRPQTETRTDREVDGQTEAQGADHVS